MSCAVTPPPSLYTSRRRPIAACGVVVVDAELDTADRQDFFPGLDGAVGIVFVCVLEIGGAGCRVRELDEGGIGIGIIGGRDVQGHLSIAGMSLCSDIVVRVVGVGIAVVHRAICAAVEGGREQMAGGGIGVDGGVVGGDIRVGVVLLFREISVGIGEFGLCDERVARISRVATDQPAVLVYEVRGGIERPADGLGALQPRQNAVRVIDEGGHRVGGAVGVGVALLRELAAVLIVGRRHA